MGISIWQLLIILVIIALLFGTKKLKNIGGDLGSAIKGFKKAINEGETPADKDAPKLEQKNKTGEIIEGSVERTDSNQEKDKR